MSSLAGGHFIFLAFVQLYPAAGWLESTIIKINTALHAVATDQPDLVGCNITSNYVLEINYICNITRIFMSFNPLIFTTI